MPCSSLPYRFSHDERGGTSQPDAATDEAPIYEQGEKLEKFDDPVQPPEVATAAAGGAEAAAKGGGQRTPRGTAGTEGVVQMLTARVTTLELNEQHKGALSLFTPWHIVEAGLLLAKIPPPQSGLARVMSATEMATALGGPYKRPRRR